MLNKLPDRAKHVTEMLRNSQVQEVIFWGFVALFILYRFCLAYWMWDLSTHWDTMRYLSVADGLLHGNYVGELGGGVFSLGTYQPFYPVFIAFISLLSGISIFDASKIAILISSSVLYVSLCTIIRFRISDLFIQLLGVALLGAHYVLAQFAFLEIQEVFLITFTYAFFALLLRHKEGYRKELLLGLMASGAYLSRIEGILVVVLWGLMTLYRMYEKKEFRITRGQIVFLSTFLLLVLPYHIMLWAKEKTFMATNTGAHLEDYAMQAGNTLATYVRNLIDNLLNLWPYYMSDFEWILLPFLLAGIGFGLYRKDKMVWMSLIFLVLIYLLYSKAFGVSYFQQRNPNEALRRYSYIIIPIVIIISAYGMDSITTYFRKRNILRILLYVILFVGTSFMIVQNLKQTPPIAQYSQKSVYLTKTGSEIRNALDFLNWNQKIIGAKQEYLVYAQIRDGIVLRYYGDDLELIENITLAKNKGML